MIGDLFILSFSTDFFLQKLSRIGHTVGAFTKNFARAHALQQLALCGSVALLEFVHDLAHLFRRGTLAYESQHETCTGNGATSPLHVAHTRPEGSGKAYGGLLIDASEVGVSAKHRLSAVEAATFLFYRYLFS
jgi:hypothetical protein